MAKEKDSSELTELKQRAKTMGLNFHPSIGLNALREKVAKKLSEPVPAPAAVAETYSAPTAKAPTEITEGQKNKELKNDALKLIRCRVTSMNPAKAEYSGEIFTSGNRITGEVTKYVHYNEPWHVPNILLNLIQRSEYQSFYSERDQYTKRTVRRSKLVPAYAVEILPTLTEEELHDLTQRQAMASGTNKAG